MSNQIAGKWILLIAATVVVALTFTSIGVLIAARRASHTAWTVASSSRLASPSPSPTETPIVLPDSATLSAPSATTVWMLIAGRLYVSTDQGASWARRQSPPYQGGGGPIRISFVDDTHGWMLFPGVPETQCNAAGAQVWRTSDGAATWQLAVSIDIRQRASNGLGSAQCKESMSFVDAEHGFVMAHDPNRRPTVYRTSDGGTMWAPATLPDPPDFKTGAGGSTLQADWVKRFGTALYLLAWGQQGEGSPYPDIHDRQYIFVSNDGGATWTWMTKVPSPQIVMVTESRWLWIVPNDSVETVDAGHQWHPFASGYQQAAPVAPQIVFGDGLVGYATVRGSIQRTVDGGESWVSISTPGAETLPPPSPAPSSPTFQCTPPPSAGWLTFSDAVYGFTITYPTGDTFERAGRGNPDTGWMAAYRAVDTCYLGGYPPGQVEVSVFKFDAASLRAWVSKHSAPKCTDPAFLYGVTNVQSVKAAARDALTFDETGKCIAEGPDSRHDTVLLLKSGYVLRVDWWSVNPKIAGTLQATADHMLATLKG